MITQNINIRKSKIWPLFLLALISGLNFIEKLKFNSIPLFQFTLIMVMIYFFLTSKKIIHPNFKVLKLYEYYILYSIIPFLFGLLFFNLGFLTFFYSFFPLLLIYLVYENISLIQYNVFLKCLNISMLLICIIGWLIRLNYLPLDFLFEVIDSEFNLGYWGIRYTTSTRNSDYLYPLVGLAISGYFFLKHKVKYYIIFIFFYFISLISSYSRGAIIISFTYLILTFIYNKNKILFLMIILLIITYFFDLIILNFNETYSEILNSILNSNNNNSKFSNEDRFEIISHAFESSLNYPLGTGIDNYKLINSNLSSRLENHAENAFLTILIERGWLALIIFLLFWIRLLKFTLKSNKFTLNKYLVFFLIIYYSINYELNNVFANFILFVVLLDYIINLKYSYEKE